MFSGNHAQTENVRVSDEESNLQQISHLETENESMPQLAKKKKEKPNEISSSTSSPAGKSSPDDNKKPRSKTGKMRGRPSKAASSERKRVDSVSKASGGDTPQSSPKARSSGVGTPKGSTKTCAATTTPKKDPMKRNAKGETLLHAACIKGKLDEVKALLDSGASPNTKDNAGWTPLHEVSSMGAVELLRAGAMPSVPGPENTTPLHDAVANKNLDVVRLLVAHGADVNARSSTGTTPLQSTDDEQILEMLREAPVTRSHHTQLLDCPPAIPGEVTVLPCGLNAAQEAQLRDFVFHLDTKLCPSHTVSFTHLVVPSNEENVCPVTTATLTAILQAKWIVNFAWIVESMEARKLLPCSQFEVKGTTDYPTSGAPRNSRINSQLQRPNLFNGCHVYLVPQPGPYTVGDLQLSKAELVALVGAGDGVLLGREPDPEAIPPSQCMVPYHAAPESPLEKCSHYLVYQPGGRGEPRLKYHMAHIKSLPITWLLACIQTFSLVQPGS